MLTQKIISRVLAAYPFAFGRWSLRRWFSRFLIARISDSTYIKTTGLTGAEWTFFDGGTKEDATVRCLKEYLQPGMTMVDVGANIGYLSLIAAERVGTGRVIAYEPTPHIAARLRENVLLNRLTNVSVIEAAVGAKTGTRQLYESGEDAEENSLYHGNGKCVNVSVVTLEESLQGIGRIDLLKIDAEGAEIDVITGFSGVLNSADAPIIICEVNPITLRAAGHSIADLLDTFNRFDYTCEILEGGLWNGEIVANYIARPRTRSRGDH